MLHGPHPRPDWSRLAHAETNAAHGAAETTQALRGCEDVDLPLSLLSRAPASRSDYARRGRQALTRVMPTPVGTEYTRGLS